VPKVQHKPIKRSELGFKRKEQKGNRSVPWSGAPDYPLCHRTVSGVPGAVHSKLLSFGFPRRSSAIIHRTVRCTSGAKAIGAQRSTLTDEQCSTITRQKSEQKVRGAPDCPVPHEDKASNGRPAPSPNDRVTWRRTGHCPMAPIASSLLQRIQFGWWL
jgi:hypothetical protein